MVKSIPCSIYRGGSSKGLFFLESDLPTNEDERISLFEHVIGKNDSKQIDGLGGAQVVTSKIAVVAPSTHIGCDVDYTFVQVYPGKPGINLSANCGNISSAVGMFAIEKGLVQCSAPVTQIRIYNTNTDRIITTVLDTPRGEVEYEGDYSIPGVKGTGRKIELMFEGPSGAITGELLPTGAPHDAVKLPSGKTVQISVVDSTSLFVLVKMCDLGLKGDESPSDIESNQPVLNDLEYIRGTVAVQLKMCECVEDAKEKAPSLPKIAIIGGPTNYAAFGNASVNCSDIDLRATMLTLGKLHKSMAVTGAMCIASACAIPGTVANELFSVIDKNDDVRIGTPAGSMSAKVIFAGDRSIKSVVTYRTARLLMKGTAYYISGD